MRWTSRHPACQPTMYHPNITYNAPRSSNPRIRRSWYAVFRVLYCISRDQPFPRSGQRRRRSPTADNSTGSMGIYKSIRCSIMI